MPRGDYFKNPENLKKRLEKRAEGRKELNNFFVRINDDLRVSRDKYNFILMKKIKAESGKYYFQSYFYSDPAGKMLVAKLKELGAIDADITLYLKRIKGIKANYVDGDIVMDIPSSFKTDEKDAELKTEAETEGEAS